MQYQKRHDLLAGRTVWVLQLENRFDTGRTLLLSKVSEAVVPATAGNHIGEGSSLDGLLKAQSGVRFVINGSFNHYRKGFYDWPHQNFHVGDPVGLVKIRDHYFEDLLEPSAYGFFVQQEKRLPWAIVGPEGLDRSAKYILGCTPLLRLNGHPTSLALDSMAPVPPGTINPPSVLGHGLQRHPRTAVGIRGTALYFLLVEGGPTQGCTLPELQEIGGLLQLDSLLNLDGGGSSQFRLRTDGGWVRNFVEPQDEHRVLGNVILLFDEAVKRG